MVDADLESLRTAKSLGMRTVLIVDPYLLDHGFRTLDASDASVDIAVRGIDGLATALALLTGGHPPPSGHRRRASARAPTCAMPALNPEPPDAAWAGWQRRWQVTI